MRKHNKRNLIIAGAVAVLLAGGGAAYAYWTTTGGTTGTATAATSADAITIAQNAILGTVKPGSSPLQVSGTLANSTTSSETFVTNITATISGVELGTTPITVPTTCSPSDFVLAPTGSATLDAGTVTIPVNAEVASTATVAWGTGTIGFTIGFNDKPSVNQNGCKGVSAIISYSFN